MGVSSSLLKDFCRGVVPPGPLYVILQISNHCNLGCEFCACHSSVGKPSMALKDMAASRAISIIRELAQMGTKEVSLSSEGEPSCHPDFADIVRMIKSSRMMLNIYTNCTTSRSDIISAYALADCLKINLSAVDQRSYDIVHAPRAPETFRQVLNNIAAIKKAGAAQKRPLLEVVYVITRHNYLYIEQAVELARAYGADSVLFKNMHLVPEMKKVDLRDPERLLLIKEVLQLTKKPLGVKTNLTSLLKELVYPSRTSFHFSRCFVGFMTMTITPDGLVRLCCANKKLRLGKWKKGCLSRIWTGNKAQTLRMLARDRLGLESVFGKDCERCPDALTNAQIEADLGR